MNETMVKYYDHCKKLSNDGHTLIELNEYSNFREILSLYEFKQCMNEKQRRKNKRNRTKHKYIELLQIKNAIQSATHVVFGTITLDDETLSKKEDTYIRKIESWLKSHFIYSILNKDFGTKTQREHYHFIGLTMEDVIYTGIKSKKGNDLYKLVNQDYKLGHEPILELVNLTNEDLDATVNYLLKLNNHSNKIGTKSRVRVLKNEKGRYIILMNALEASKGEKMAKKRRILLEQN